MLYCTGSLLTMRRPGFTILELLLVIGILVALGSIVFLAIRPSARFAAQRDLQRRSDMQTILTFVRQYIGDKSGELPGNLSRAKAGWNYQLCNCNVGFCPPPAACGLPGTPMINLRALSGSYFVDLPHDPLAPATASGSRYFVRRDRNNRLTVLAPDGESVESIKVGQ